MRSLTIVAVSAVLLACAIRAPAAIAGATGAATAPGTCPVTHCPKGSFLNGDACFVKRCRAVMCPKFEGVCPAGTHVGQQSPSDCCKDACVKDCKRPLPATD